jgi:hypothetical protein
MHRLLICPPDASSPAMWRHVQGVYWPRLFGLYCEISDRPLFFAWTSPLRRSVHTKKPRSDISQYRLHARSISRYYYMHGFLKFSILIGWQVVRKNPYPDRGPYFPYLDGCPGCRLSGGEFLLCNFCFAIHTKKPRSDISQYRPHDQSISRYYWLPSTLIQKRGPNKKLCIE